MTTHDTVIDSAIQQLAARCLLINLRCRFWTAKATDKRVALDVESREKAASGTTRVTKTLIDDKYIKDIMKHVTAGRRLVESYTVPWSAAGGRIAPAERLPEFLQEFGAVEQKFNEAVDKLRADYFSLKNRAQLSLGDMFDPSLYPAQEELIHRFGMDLSVSEVPVGSDFRFDLPDEIRGELKHKLRQSVSTAVDDVRKDLLRRLTTPILALQDKLNTKDMKKFSPALIKNIKDVAVAVDDLNIFDDPDIKRVTKRLMNGQLTGSINREACRVDDAVRVKQADGFAQDLSKLGVLDLL